LNITYLFEDANSNMSNWQKINFIDELSQSGYSFNLINIFDFESPNSINLKLKSVIEKNKIDYFITSISNVIIDENIFNLFKIKGIPTILICFDNLHAPYIHEKSCNFFDLVWLTSNENEDLFRKWGSKKIIFQPYAANPYFYKFNQRNKLTNRISFVGTPYGSRKNLINKLAENSLPVDLYSNNYSNESNLKTDIKNFNLHAYYNVKTKIGRKIIWSAFLNKYVMNNKGLHDSVNCKSSLSFKSMTNLYSTSKVNLNVIELRNTFVLKNPIYKIHLRTFEIPMSGGIQLVAHTNELSEYFEEDKEVLFYKSEEELVDKAKYYLNNATDTTIRSIQASARKRAENDHTWGNRFNKLFKSL